MILIAALISTTRSSETGLDDLLPSSFAWVGFNRVPESGANVVATSMALEQETLLSQAVIQAERQSTHTQRPTTSYGNGNPPNNSPHILRTIADDPGCGGWARPSRPKGRREMAGCSRRHVSKELFLRDDLVESCHGGNRLDRKSY